MEPLKTTRKPRKGKGTIHEQFTHSGDKINDGNTMISFGKYKDLKTLSDVYEQDPGYYHWFSKMNKEPRDHLNNADKRNKQADVVLKYIKNRGAVEPLKETVKFIKNTSKRALPILKQNEANVLRKLEMGQTVSNVEMNQTLNKGGPNTKTININVVPVKDDKQMIVGKPKTIQLK